MRGPSLVYIPKQCGHVCSHWRPGWSCGMQLGACQSVGTSQTTRLHMHVCGHALDHIRHVCRPYDQAIKERRLAYASVAGNVASKWTWRCLGCGSETIRIRQWAMHRPTPCIPRKRSWLGIRSRDDNEHRVQGFSRRRRRWLEKRYAME